jgi:hypothetical protein
VDDIQIAIPPVLTAALEKGDLQLLMDDLIPGTTYTLRTSPDLVHWTTATTIKAAPASAT